MVVAYLPIALPLVEVYDGSIFKFLRNGSLLPKGLEQLGELLDKYRTSSFVDLCGYGVCPWGFATR